MKYCKNYCEEEGISTSELNEAQRTLYYIAENMKMNKFISKEGYRHFQTAIKALEQEPKIGHWINGDDKCPCCGKSKYEGLDADIWSDWQPRFCPNCGTKMIEIQNLKYADADMMMPAT